MDDGKEEQVESILSHFSQSEINREETESQDPMGGTVVAPRVTPHPKNSLDQHVF